MKTLIILIFIPIIGLGQHWETSFGGINNDESGESVQQTTDGGYIITGSTASFGNGGDDIYLIKTNSDGLDNWYQTFGGTGNDYGKCVKQTNDGGYIITGYTNSFGSGLNDVYLIKTDPNGIEEWQRTFGGIGNEFGYSVQQTNDGGYIVVGYTTSFGNGSTDVYLIKTDDTGVEEWNQTFGGTSVERGYSVQQTDDDGYIIAGYTTSFGNGSSNVYLIKTYTNGVEEWNKIFGGPDIEKGYDVKQTNDSGYIITGSIKNVSWDVYMIKTDINGIEEWNQSLGGVGYDDGRSVEQTNDGGYIIGGTTASSGSGGNDVSVMKTDENGIEEWSQTFGGINDDSGQSIQQTNDGGYIITGTTNSFNNISEEIYLIKMGGITISSLIENACGSYTAPDGQIYSSTGTYTATITDGAGFDSVIVNIDLTINPLPNNNITQNGDLLFAEPTATAYQWINCNNDNNIIIGEINQFYIPTITGSYAVEVNLNGCIDTSDCILVDFAGIEELNSQNRALVKITDFLGRETPFKPNTPLLYIYSDGRVERKLVINY